VCCLVAVLLVVRLVRRVAGPGPALLGGIVATQFALGGWVNGMEGPVVLLVGAALATALAAADRSPTRYSVVVVGVLSGLLVLARLDFAPVLALLLVALVLRWRSARRVGEWAVGVAVIGVPAALWWLLSWGHVLSTSATVKQQWLQQAYSREFGGRLSWGYADFLAGVTEDYARSLDVWSSLVDRSFVVRHVPRLAGLPRLGGLLLLALAMLGAGVALQHWLRRPRNPRSRWSPEAWAIGVSLTIAATKAALDLVVAPLWAEDWYADPQRLVMGFLVGAGAWMGLRTVARRRCSLAVACAVLLAVLVIPVNMLSWRSAVRSRPTETWQDQLDIAADWILDEGPSGRYGARDAGLIGYRLDEVPVVNLDGLVNDYDFTELTGRDASLRARIAQTRVDYFVGRVDDRMRADLYACGDVIWTSPERVPYADALTPFNRAPVVVADTRGCRS
jgi:hypothetical protein